MWNKYALTLINCYALKGTSECDITKGDGRDVLGNLNDDNPGTAINLFDGLTTTVSGRIINITYYTIKIGPPFISFWKPTTRSREFELMNKVQIDTTTTGSIEVWYMQ